MEISLFLGSSNSLKIKEHYSHRGVEVNKLSWKPNDVCRRVVGWRGNVERNKSSLRFSKTEVVASYGGTR